MDDNKIINNQKDSPKGDRVVLILAIIVGFLAGFIGGFFVGDAKAENGTIDASSGNSPVYTVATDAEETTAENDPYADDYTKYVINQEKGITIDSFYADNETRYAAKNLIGRTLPEVKWTDSANVVHSTAEYASGKYILEFFLPTCTYCNASIPEVDEFRNSHNVVSLAFESGDISAFNTTGENAFIVDNMTDTEVDSFTSMIAWVPCFLFIEDNEVKLVEFGAVDASSLTDAWDVAFD